MRKIIIALFALVCFATAAQAQRSLLLRDPLPTTGGGLDPATTLWVNQVSSNGGAVTAPRRAIVNTFITCLKTAANGNLFNILDRYYLLAGEDVPSSSTDMIHPAASAFVNHGMTFLANNYVSGNGTSQYLDTGYNPNTAGGHYLQDSATMLMHIHNQRTTLSNVMSAGGDNAGAFTQVVKINGFDTGATGPTAYINDSASISFAGIANSQGSLLITRTGHTTRELYRNGSGVTDSAASVGIPTTNIYIGAMDFAGPFGYVPDQISTWGVGGGMTANNVSDFQSCESAMLGSIGIYP